MQRTAVQGSPDMLTAITGVYTPGAARVETEVHPFRRTMTELRIGGAVVTDPRAVTGEDVAHFADFTGDTFYAHTDPEAAAANPLFGGIVAHGYLVLSLAAGLFVDPAPGPLLANTGLDRLRFTKPVKPGDSIRAVLTCASKTPRSPQQGEVRWDVQLLDRTTRCARRTSCSRWSARSGPTGWGQPSRRTSRSAGARQLARHTAPSAHDHQHGLPRTARLGPGAACPVDVRGHDPDAADVPQGPDRRGDEREGQRCAQPSGRHDPRQAERSSKVLGVHQAVHQGDAPA